MNTQQKAASRTRPAVTWADSTVDSSSARRSSRPSAATTLDTEHVLDQCVGASCLVEVTLHSLESQEIACPEQEVLKRALRAIWSVYDWIDELSLAKSHRGTHRKSEP